MSNTTAEGTPPLLVQRGPVPTIYAEGISQISLGFPVCRLRLHSSSEVDPANPTGQQVREICAEIVMPTLAAIEFAQNVLSAINQNVDIISRFREEQTRKLDEFFAATDGK